MRARNLGLNFTRIEAYPRVPPQPVRDALRDALATSLFEEFVIAEVVKQSVKQPDPILFGVVTGKPAFTGQAVFYHYETDNDYYRHEELYFIAQWGDDVRLSDILKA